LNAAAAVTELAEAPNVNVGVNEAVATPKLREAICQQELLSDAEISK
jgi:hypothetical protein